MAHNRTTNAPENAANRDSKTPLLMLGVVIFILAVSAAAIAAPTHTTTRTVYRTPAACTRAALADSQAQTRWLAIEAAHEAAESAALHHATVNQFRRALFEIPAVPRQIVDLAVCR